MQAAEHSAALFFCMSHALRHIQFAVTIIEHYDGALPLSAYLKQYFAANKKFGSKDRRYIADACYSYYRLGKALPLLSTENRVIVGLFLCSSYASYWSVAFTEGMLTCSSMQEKLGYIQQAYPEFELTAIFPWGHWLSETIDIKVFAPAHLIQPDVFIRARPGKQRSVQQKLHQAGIAFEMLAADCIAVEQGAKLEEVLIPQQEYVVQDASSQQVGSLLQSVGKTLDKRPLKVWDCCAASGGKSILANDVLGKLQLYVSDIRESILINLRKRFAMARIKEYQAYVADVSKGVLPKALQQTFDLVICDAPCSGSGTWGRTPEQIAFFTEEKLYHYQTLQKSISVHAANHVKQGGYFLYITCSVFRQENEAVVEHLLQSTKLKLVTSQVIKGYEHKADSMFAALLVLEPSVD